jgi:hypothetical protein
MAEPDCELAALAVIVRAPAPRAAVGRPKAKARRDSERGMGQAPGGMEVWPSLFGSGVLDLT